MKKKKIKCRKCGLRFNEKELLEGEFPVMKELCFNCGFIWKTIGLFLQSFGECRAGRKSLNREVVIKLDDVIIRKKRNFY